MDKEARYLTPINEISLCKWLSNKNIHIKYFDVIDSTNSYIKNNMHKLDGRTLVIAREQSNGVGKYKRPFLSPKDNGIYMSILLKDTRLSSPILITPLLATIVMNILKEMGFDVKTKWVNDIFLNDKKILGILTEGTYDRKSNTYKNLIIGLGLNILDFEFPLKFRNIVTSLLFESTDKIIKDKILSLDFNEFASNILVSMIDFIDSLSREDEKKKDYEKIDALLMEYNENLINYKKVVTFSSKDDTLSFTFLGIDRNAKLICINEHGEKILLDSNKYTLNDERN